MAGDRERKQGLDQKSAPTRGWSLPACKRCCLRLESYSQGPYVFSPDRLNLFNRNLLEPKLWCAPFLCAAGRGQAGACNGGEVGEGQQELDALAEAVLQPLTTAGERTRARCTMEISIALPA